VGCGGVGWVGRSGDHHLKVGRGVELEAARQAIGVLFLADAFRDKDAAGVGDLEADWGRGRVDEGAGALDGLAEDLGERPVLVCSVVGREARVMGVVGFRGIARQFITRRRSGDGIVCVMLVQP
jgi:hypothetical protein